MGLSTNIKLLKLLADETRIKILRIAKEAEFTVNEFVSILDLHQSNVSRHLNQLKEAGFLSDRKEGTLNFYRWSEDLKSDKSLKNLIESAFNNLTDSVSILNFMRQVLGERQQKQLNFFDQVAGRYRKIAEPGGAYEGLVVAMSSLIEAEAAVDIGCGEGELSLQLARACKKIIAVDLSGEMLKVVAQKCLDENIPNVETRQGDSEALPLENEEVDLAILSQVLHHAPNPPAAITELARVLKPKGRFILLDLHSHNFEWMREKMGDLWLGFQENDIQTWLTEAGLEIEITQTIDIANGLPLLFVKGQKI